MVNSAGFRAGECGEFGVGLSAAEGLRRSGVRPGSSRLSGWKSHFPDEMLQEPQCARDVRGEPPSLPLPLSHLEDGVGLR